MPDPNDPQTFNRYAYVLNNPLRYTDPTGHCATCHPGFDVSAAFPSTISQANRFDFGLPTFNTLSYSFNQPASYNFGVNTLSFGNLGGAGSNLGGFVGQNAFGGFARHGFNFSSTFNNHNGFLFSRSSGNRASDFLDTLKNVADYAGYIPGLNVLASLVSAGISAFQGDYSEAGLSLFNVIPGVKQGRAVFSAVRGGLEPVRLGQIGERLAGITSGLKQRIDSLTGTAKFRVPDQLTPDTLREIKNVGRLRTSGREGNQLRDFSAFSQQTGRLCELCVRENTIVTPRQQQFLDDLKINLIRELP